MKTYKRKYNTPEYRKKYTGIYGTWYALRQRCDNPNNKQYKDYGGRGISYPKTWSSFESFKADMQDGYRVGLTIDRINNLKSYSKENCRWASRKEQNNNKRSNIVLSFKGETLPLAIWAEKIGVPFNTIRSRFYRGMDIKDVLKPELFRPAKI